MTLALALTPVALLTSPSLSLNFGQHPTFSAAAAAVGQRFCDIGEAIQVPIFTYVYTYKKASSVNKGVLLCVTANQRTTMCTCFQV